MHKIMGVTEVQRRFRTVFDEVAKKHIPYVLTRGSRPEAALIPYEDFVRFQEMQEKGPTAASSTSATNDSAWEVLAQLVEDCAVQTGITDLSHQHDHYLYGKPKSE
ncbi:MAG: hypothetical protein A2Z04_07615 [Chloroflexi bacterium RBG_16_57_9]|nr:MAG: hypothetical protein A2Z04_07615 [Chloroflexi bacterium RBG_16_57_9]